MRFMLESGVHLQGREENGRKVKQWLIQYKKMKLHNGENCQFGMLIKVRTIMTDVCSKC